MPAEEDWAPEEAGARSWLEEADALAREGRFAEAIHHLLFRSIEDIANRRPAVVRPALTSRELAASDGIPGRARDLFAAHCARWSSAACSAAGRSVSATGSSAREAYSDFALADGVAAHERCCDESGARIRRRRLQRAHDAAGHRHRLLAFIAMLVLGAYAPDLRSGHNGGSHALSNAATGFSGLVRLAEATGRGPHIVRSVPDLESEDLAVITPDHRLPIWRNSGYARPARHADRASEMAYRTAVAHPGWVRVAALASRPIPEDVLAPADQVEDRARPRAMAKSLLNVDPTAPAEMRFLAPRGGPDDQRRWKPPARHYPLGGIVLGQLGKRHLYVLSRARSHQQSRHGQ